MKYMRLFQFVILLTAEFGITRSILYPFTVFFKTICKVFPDKRSSVVRRLLIPIFANHYTIVALEVIMKVSTDEFVNLVFLKGVLFSNQEFYNFLYRIKNKMSTFLFYSISICLKNIIKTFLIGLFLVIRKWMRVK